MTHTTSNSHNAIPATNVQLGIDLGGTKIEIVALTEHLNQGLKSGASSSYQEIIRNRIDTPRPISKSKSLSNSKPLSASESSQYQRIVDAICQLVTDTEAELTQHFQQPITTTLGLGIPGAISPQTGLVKNANTVCLIGKPLAQDLMERLQREIIIANDADCFALSEANDGSAQGATSVFGVIIGTGCGGGCVINGQLLNGPNAIAGEWGHNPLPWPTKMDILLDCYCGKQGCIETFLSGPGFSEHLNQWAAQTTEHEPLIAKLNAKHWHKRLLEQDPIAVQGFEQYCDRMARSLASIINVLDPEVIVFGGGMSNIDLIYTELPNRLPQYVFSDSFNTKLVKAKHGDSSGVRGAAWLGLQAAPVAIALE